MSPYKLELLLWIYARPDLDEWPHKSAPAFNGTLQWLYSKGVIDRCDFPKLTPMGEAWVKLILKTPFPEPVFIDPRTKEPV